MNAQILFDKFAFALIEEVLVDVCDTYNLPIEEDLQKYCKVPAQKKARPSTSTTSSAVTNAMPCQGKTAKGLPCKKSCKDGSGFCHLHRKTQSNLQTIQEEAGEIEVSSRPRAERKNKKKKAKDMPQTQHNHDPDDHIHDDCEECVSYGNVLVESPGHLEDWPDNDGMTLRERLQSAMDNDFDPDLM